MIVGRGARASLPAISARGGAAGARERREHGAEIALLRLVERGGAEAAERADEAGKLPPQAASSSARSSRPAS